LKAFKIKLLTKSWFFKKVNKTNKPLANLTRRRREKTQINKIRDEKGNIITNANEIQRTIRQYFKNLYTSKLENLKMDKFQDTFDQIKLNQKDINHINRSITNNETEIVIVFQQRKALDLMVLLLNSTRL
jgi:hypothetical protein